MARRESLRMDHPIITTILILAIVAFMYFAGEVLKPLALAVLLSFALAPLCRLLERAGLPRTPSVVISVVVSLGLLGAIGTVVMRQLNALAHELPQYQGRIEEKLTYFQSKEQNAAERIMVLGERVAKKLEPPKLGEEATNIQRVEIVRRPSFQERLTEAVGPVLETIGVGFFVLILVLFILMKRDDLSDRLVEMFGFNQISVTTRTMEEVGRRISRYLATLAAVNSTFGVIVGCGLGLLHVPYAVLWGFLAGALRFIPYVGPASAALFPLVFSFAHFTGMAKPLEVLALFAVLEVIANSFLEPVIYGKTTGVSALGLLVSAMFWTWLWGAVGLLLSTPLTVCLAVLGKSVPSLRAFGALLGEESELPADVRLYQRLIAFDQDGAVEIVENALSQKTRVTVFDEVLIPLLSRAEREFSRGEIEEREQAFIWRVVGDLLDALDGTPEIALQSITPPDGTATITPVKLFGIPANDEADSLALRMLDLALAPAGIDLQLVPLTGAPLERTDAVVAQAPDLVIVSHLPPVGLTPTRYLVRRVRARLRDTPVFAGRWGEGGDTDDVTKKLMDAGASKVVFSIALARDQVLELSGAKSKAPSTTGNKAVLV